MHPPKRHAQVISIHALRGEGDFWLGTHFQSFDISIHALRGEGDVFSPLDNALKKYFNPRPPWGGRLSIITGIHLRTMISIHALRGEGDFTRCFRS